jgi:hypothetical protein
MLPEGESSSGRLVGLARSNCSILLVCMVEEASEGQSSS